jgi:sialic acid synthase SpsE
MNFDFAEISCADIAGRRVGPGQPVWIVGELGVTHEGTLDVAVEMLDASAKAGIDAIKVECINADTLVSDEYRSSLLYSFKTLTGRTITENYYELLTKVSLSFDEIGMLAALAKERNLLFFGTAFDLDTVDFLKSIGACAIKISSGEITHHPLLQRAAKSGLPVFFDTGRASIGEVLAAVEILRSAGCPTPLVMHNPSGYPAAHHDVQLNSIALYQQATGLPVGLSCHSRGNMMVHGAIAVGANVIEKPLSRDNTKEEDEHIFSVNIHELDRYVEEIRALEQAFAVSREKLYVGDTDPVRRRTFRQSLVAARDLPKGYRIKVSDITFARPGLGLAPSLLDFVVGRRVNSFVPAGHHITCKVIE